MAALLYHMIAKKFDQTTFRYKLILTYILLIFVPVTLALFFYGTQLYKQANSYYEDILEQLNQRTNVTIDDFFTNLTRNSFFYLTDSKLHAIMGKTNPTDAQQYIRDTNLMQNAMEQFVLINGNISTIMVMAPNGRVYGSKPDKAQSFIDVVEQIGKEKVKSSSFVVTVPDSFGRNAKKNQTVSIIRYLSDLNLQNTREAYAKLDIHFKAIENMLGGIDEKEQKLGTFVLADEHVIYNSNSRTTDKLTGEQSQQLFDQLRQLEFDNTHEQFAQIKWNNERYLVSGSVNKATGWRIIHTIPSDEIVNTFFQSTVNYALFAVLALIAALLLSFFFHRYFINPILKLSRAMRMVDGGHLYHAMPKSEREDEIGKLINSYNDMLERLKQSRESELVSSGLQKKAEMKMLQAQINPHFLYNTLNAIHSISELHRLDDISTMTRALSSLYRYNIKYGDEVTIEKELEQINNYVRIQQIRFLNRFQVEYDIDPDVLQYKILKFLIQPIIENSFYHGLEPKGGQGMLSLTIKRQAHTLHIRIQDNGVGISDEKMAELQHMFTQQEDATLETDSERNFGLRNVHTRIKHFYGESYWMNVSGREQGGTTIEMMISLNKGEDDR